MIRINSENPLPPPTLWKGSTHLIVPHNGEDAATPSSGEADSKKRTLSVDNSSNATKLVQHVVSTSSFMPENYQAHEFSAARPEDMVVPAWEIQQNGYPHLYPYYYHRGFPSPYPPPMIPFPPYVADPHQDQGHWIPQGQPGFDCHAPSFPDNGTIVQQQQQQRGGGYVMMNDGGWTPRMLCPESLFYANFIDDPSSSRIVDSRINNYCDLHHPQDEDDDDHKESFRSNNNTLDYDPYAPLPAGCRDPPPQYYTSGHFHEERSMDGWIDGCLTVLNEEVDDDEEEREEKSSRSIRD